MAQNNKATQQWKILKNNLVRATALAKRFASGRFQKLNPVPYCMYQIEYMESESESDNESDNERNNRANSWQRQNLEEKETPDSEVVKKVELITVPDEPMEEEMPKMDSYAIHSTNMSQQIDRVASELGWWEIP